MLLHLLQKRTPVQQKLKALQQRQIPLLQKLNLVQLRQAHLRLMQK